MLTATLKSTGFRTGLARIGEVLIIPGLQLNPLSDLPIHILPVFTGTGRARYVVCQMPI